MANCAFTYRLIVALVFNLAEPQSTFSAEQLRAGCPDGVERTRKEEYLDAESFAAEFGCTTEEFAAMPAWRQQAAKKRVGLY